MVAGCLLIAIIVIIIIIIIIMIIIVIIINIIIIINERVETSGCPDIVFQSVDPIINSRNLSFVQFYVRLFFNLYFLLITFFSRDVSSAQNEEATKLSFYNDHHWIILSLWKVIENCWVLTHSEASEVPQMISFKKVNLF